MPDLLQERTSMMDNVFAHRHNSRPMTGSNIYTWKIMDAGYKLRDGMYDNALHLKINDDFAQLFDFDAYNDKGTRNMFRVASALSGGGTLHHEIDDAADSLIIRDHEIMLREEYEEATRDIYGFFWSKSLRRTVPELTLGQLRDAVAEYQALQKFGKDLAQLTIDKHRAMFVAQGGIRMPMDDLLVALRGIKGLSLDLRKCKTQVKDWMDMSFEQLKMPFIEASLNSELPEGYGASQSLVLMAHSILNYKQFEELYWPYMKRVIDMAVANNKRISIFCESSMLRFKDFFQEIPKGYAILNVEQDDLLEVRKACPNLALFGGLTPSTLGYGTKEECVNAARTLVDTLGDGFILSQSVMVSYRNDVKRENLLAVQEFAKNYRY